MTITKEEFLTEYKEKLLEDYSVSPVEANVWQQHNAVAGVLMKRLMPDIRKSERAHNETRRACYFSAEFLIGRAIYNNLLCLGLTDMVNDALKECGVSLCSLEEVGDASLGNGGLGRLAACFLDSAATMNLPLDGYGIRYRYGLFKQKFQDGFQVEEADDWTAHGDAWSRRKDGESVLVKFADQTVNAVPYDMPVIGYHTDNVGNLRLWQAESIHPFDFRLFNDQKYDEAVREKNRAEDISRVLYPNDSTTEGKILRLKQEYFFSSASLADIIRKFKIYHGNDLTSFGDFITIQLNDTHPVIAIPELIRRLTQEEGMEFYPALGVAKSVFNYTNHTIMAEALETWPADLMKQVVPEVYDVVCRINETMTSELKSRGVPDNEIEKYRAVSGGFVHMARLAVYISRFTNGVAEIHSQIIKDKVFNEWYSIFPQRFLNETNGVTQRRWLALCNKELCQLLTQKLGSDAFITDLSRLKELVPAADDAETIRQFIEIKQKKKEQLAVYIAEHENIEIDPYTIFDVQIKRLHEYKRQLLNAFSILYLYFGIKEGSITNFAPTTFLFGAKSAPGYFRAKGIIKYINEIAKLIDNDPAVRDKLKVVFVHDYNVSYAEKLVAAADVSVQISTAGTEASGTGNMKLMMNGAVTLGTLDGANVEIVKEVGEENSYIFGAKVEELRNIMTYYNPRAIYDGNPKIKRVVDTLVNGTVSDGGNGSFYDIYNSLLNGSNGQRPDIYYVLGDLDSFISTRLRLNTDYKNPQAFYKKCFLNVCCSGKFSSDRTIRGYAKDIWNIDPVEFN